MSDAWLPRPAGQSPRVEALESDRVKRLEQQVARLTEENVELQRENRQLKVGLDPLCLVCGAKEPCTDGVACTFDPTPQQVWDKNRELRESLAAKDEALARIETMTNPATYGKGQDIPSVPVYEEVWLIATAALARAAIGEAEHEPD